MTTKNDYTQEEWEKVMTAPMTAGMIVAAVPGWRTWPRTTRSAMRTTLLA